jgi:hypothetical protein
MLEYWCLNTNQSIQYCNEKFGALQNDVIIISIFVAVIVFLKEKCLKIQNRQTYTVNQKTDNTMVKRKMAKYL